MKSIAIALHLLGGLAVFLYGLKVMSEGLQKLASNRLRQILAKATDNPLKATVSGFLITCAVQSSSATTVMVVGFCSAGLLTLYQSLGIIFGANIGTTTTGWLVSLLGFKVKIASFALPLIGIGFFSQFIKRWRAPHRIGEVLVGFGFLFLGLSLLKEGIPDIHQTPMVYEWLARFDANQFGTRIIVVLIGALLTFIFQSSSAMMAVTLAAAAKGIIDFPTASALVLGENIGTTITANLASIGAPLVAKRAARGHLFFNIFGIIWAMLIFNWSLKFVDFIVPGDPYSIGETALLVYIPTHIAAFHTIFNVTNTIIVLPFIGYMERLIIWFLPESKSEQQDHELIHITTPLTRTPELGIVAAKHEVDRMAGVCVNMLQKIKEALNTDKKKVPDLLRDIRKGEKTTDILEHKINEYLASLTHEHLSTSANKEVISLFSMINDLERIGDHGEKLAILIERTQEKSNAFITESKKEIGLMADKTLEILQDMKNLILNGIENPIPAALEREESLNKLRYQFRQSHIERMSKGKSTALSGIVFTDMLTSFEKMGDHAFNVIEATVGGK